MYVVATAGHVDHGKSTLVEALTGRSPDRLDEERRRGLSIELGYCWTALEHVGDVAFVDVPGHERFIATTLAGMGPVPVVMFVVAADDPWMPQAAEHLAALDALGVEHGLLVVTRSDLADPAPALARARLELSVTSLAGAPAVTVSGRTGEGLDDLREALVRVLAALPAADESADVRLWVDRRFHVRGAGTVVTGTLPAGTIAVGDELEAGSSRVRVRGIESLEQARERVQGPARVALDLGGRAPEEVTRGTTLVTPGAWQRAESVDVRLVAAGVLPDRPVLHLGSALVGVHARPLGKEHARLVLEHALPLRIGDRGLVRDPGSRALWGIEVVDPMPPPLRRRGAAAARGVELAGHDASLATQLDLRGVVRRSQLRRIGAQDEPVPAGTVSVGDWLVGPAQASALAERLARVVADAPDLGPPVSLVVAAHQLGLPDPALVAGLVRPPLRIERGAVVDEGHADVPPQLAAALAEVRSTLTGDPFAAPDRSRLRELGLDSRALAVLERLGTVLRLEGDVVLLPGAADVAVRRLRHIAQPFTASAARQALATSRRVVLPLLDHLDRTARTRRLPDDRREVLDAPGSDPRPGEDRQPG